MKRSVLAYVMLPIMAVVIIVGGSLLLGPERRPAGPARPAYRLTVVAKAGTSTPARYGVLPDPKEKRLAGVLASGIVQQMLDKGATVTFQTDPAPVADKDRARLAKLGWHVVSVEPKEFAGAGAVTIKAREVKPPAKPAKAK